MIDVRAAVRGVLLALWLCGSAWADGPDHLVPVDPHPSKSIRQYREKLDAVLGLSKFELDDDGHFIDGVLVVVVQEAFDPETLLIFKGGTLTRVSPDRNIWYSMPGHQRRGAKNWRRPIKVQSVSIDLDAERSQRIAVLIEKLLRNTHYPAADIDGVEDSTAYEFRLRSKQLFGETTNEAAGPAKRLIDIIEALARLEVQPNGRVSEDSLMELDRMSENLESAIASDS